MIHAILSVVVAATAAVKDDACKANGCEDSALLQATALWSKPTSMPIVPTEPFSGILSSAPLHGRSALSTLQSSVLRKDPLCCSWNQTPCDYHDVWCDENSYQCSQCSGEWIQMCCSWDGITCTTDPWCDVNYYECAACSGHWIYQAAGSSPSSEEVPSTTPSLWRAVDGGTDRACRGEHSNDDSDAYYIVHDEASITECKNRCLEASCCSAIEYHPISGRCETWIKRVEATAPVNSYSCYRLQPAPDCLEQNEPKHANTVGTPAEAHSKGKAKPKHAHVVEPPTKVAEAQGGSPEHVLVVEAKGGEKGHIDVVDKVEAQDKPKHTHMVERRAEAHSKGKAKPKHAHVVEPPTKVAEVRVGKSEHVLVVEAKAGEKGAHRHG